MAAGKVKLAFIVQRSKRKAAYNKRKRSVLKKLEELTTLCGIEACAIIECKDLEARPTYWPSREQVTNVLGEFSDIPVEKRTKHMESVVSVLKKEVAKVEEKGKNKMWEKRQKELERFLLDCLAGRSDLGTCRAEDRGGLMEMVDRKIVEIEMRVDSLKGNAAGQGAGPSSS